MQNPPLPFDVKFPVLLADIGGTHSRIALLDNPQAAIPPLAHRLSVEITDLPAHLRQLCETRPVRTALLAVAGVVDSPRMTLTNLPWSIDAEEIGHALSLQAVLLINDFEAQAAATTAFDVDDTATLQEGVGDAEGTRLIVGAGTGFGTAFLRPYGNGFCIIPSEAGHMELPLADGDEDLFAAEMRRSNGRVSIEDIISGPGLSRLDHVLHKLASPRSAAAIVAARQAGDERAAATMRVWQRLLASTLANLVIAGKATGGAWIAGGVITHLAQWIDRQSFLAAFIDKPPMTALLARTPVHIVTRPDAAFLGLRAIAAAPHRFGLIAPHGLWRA